MNKFLTLLLVGFGICFASSLTLVSCKSKSATIKSTKNISRLTADKIIEKHYNNKNKFITLYIKSNVRYANDKETQRVTAEIKIKRDEKILISIRFFGITMAKVLITPIGVSYYEKIGGSYFEGDFSALSQWLGTDLDFNKIQNMLTGEAIDDLSKGVYKESLEQQLYRLDDLSNTNTKKSFFFDPSNFLVKRQEIDQNLEERMIKISYLDNKIYNEFVLPSNVIIETHQKTGNTEIDLDYNTVTLNEELSFPYSVPNGYKRIIIK